MHLSTVNYIVAAVAVTWSGATASFVDKEVYLAKIAPGLLDRISKYRASKSRLTTAQVAALELADKVVRNYDVDNVKTLESACSSAFGKDECFKTFASESINAKAPNYCTCSTENDWCWGSKVCARGLQNCNTTASKHISNQIDISSVALLA